MSVYLFHISTLSFLQISLKNFQREEASSLTNFSEWRVLFTFRKFASLMLAYCDYLPFRSVSLNSGHMSHAINALNRPNNQWKNQMLIVFAEIYLGGSVKVLRFCG